MSLSLRSKLILTMSLVVAGATVGTSIITQGYVRQMYQRKFEDDFKAEVRFFSERQLQRLSTIRKRCLKLAKDEAVITGIQKHQPRIIYSKVTEELQEFSDARASLDFMGQSLGPGAGPLLPVAGKPAKNDPMVPKNSARPLVRVVDAQGEIIATDDPRAPGAPLLLRKATLAGKRLEQMRNSMKLLAQKVTDEQEVAYIMDDAPEGKLNVREFIVTPVLAPADRSLLGAIIVGMAMPDLGEREMHSFSQQTSNDPHAKDDTVDESISSGFWLEGRLHTQTIRKEAREIVEKTVSEGLASGHTGAGFTQLTVDLPQNGETVKHALLYRVLNPDSPFPPACQVAMYSLTNELAAERELQSKIISIGLLALALALALVLFVSRGLIRPILALVKGTEEIRLGNYDVRVPVRSRDEVGRLAESFNEMAEGLKLNRKYQRLLSQVADRLVAEQLMNIEASLGGELRDVSVIFCDIRGFTNLTSGMPPGEVIALLNEHMTALTAIVHEHGGVVDKFVGDMIMALFGAPSAYGDDAMRAAQCALRMVLRRDELNEHSKWRFQVGIGIATGNVIAGCMGSEERLDYTVLGERVNLASRLCSKAAPGEVLIDDATLEKLDGTATSEPVLDLELKGFSETVTAHRLLGMVLHAGS
ncbi:MAG: Adenylate cyclase, class 3 [Verrucomicrobiaceae bacterium]|nr:Adenylate cyclase, class 3 [Verrucomicrobiaceae bacterium]